LGRRRGLLLAGGWRNHARVGESIRRKLVIASASAEGKSIDIMIVFLPGGPLLSGCPCVCRQRSRGRSGDLSVMLTPGSSACILGSILDEWAVWQTYPVCSLVIFWNHNPLCRPVTCLICVKERGVAVVQA